ncbi:UNVERIFIED_CONTAM: hypothetical protein Sangu_0188900 [Sesamum angustifolium]|uniref:Uncharacterized protein n=1 Tax=Sesamum angustifolium TaxID=2727405 RepID=A0AAW2RM48_9LAMI
MFVSTIIFSRDKNSSNSLRTFLLAIVSLWLIESHEPGSPTMPPRASGESNRKWHSHRFHLRRNFDILLSKDLSVRLQFHHLQLVTSLLDRVKLGGRWYQFLYQQQNKDPSYQDTRQWLQVVCFLPGNLFFEVVKQQIGPHHPNP